MGKSNRGKMAKRSKTPAARTYASRTNSGAQPASRNVTEAHFFVEVDTSLVIVRSSASVRSWLSVMSRVHRRVLEAVRKSGPPPSRLRGRVVLRRSEEHTSELQSRPHPV